mgnify:CR=1 FL=1
MLVFTRKRNQGGTTGALNRGITEIEGGATRSNDRATPTTHRELAMRLRTMNKTNIFLNKITTGKPVSTHKHTDNARWSLCRKHSGFPRSRGSLPKPAENNERDRGEELGPSPTLLRPRQNAIPTLPFFPPFYSQGEEDVNWLHHLYSLSFRTEMRLNLPLIKYVLPRIFTSADLHLKYVQHIKTCACT